MHVTNKISYLILHNICKIYKKKWLLLSVLVYYYLAPSTVNCRPNEQMYGRTLYLHLHRVSHLHIVVKFVSAYYIKVYGSKKLKHSRYQF